MTEPADADLELYRRALKQRRLRISRARDNLVRLFLASERHWSPEELFQEAQSRGLRTGLSTVYRALKLLLEIGLAREVDLGDEVRHYERSTSFPNHYHLVCARCHAITEFIANAIEDQVRSISAAHAFLPSGHVLKVEGVCERCRGDERHRSAAADGHDLVLKRDALAAVIAVEKVGYAFYAAKTAPVGPALSRLLKTLREEEAEHLAILQREWTEFIARNPRIRSTPPILHQTLPWKERPGIPAGASEETILLHAIDWERMTARFFRAEAENLSPCEAREIFLKFSEAEKVHLILLQAEYNRRTGKGIPYLDAQI